MFVSGVSYPGLGRNNIVIWLNRNEEVVDFWRARHPLWADFVCTVTSCGREGVFKKNTLFIFTTTRR